MKITLKSNSLKHLCLFLTCFLLLGKQSIAQSFNFKVLEVFEVCESGKKENNSNTFEGEHYKHIFDYTLAIVSGKDTIRPQIKEKFYFAISTTSDSVSIVITVKKSIIRMQNIKASDFKNISVINLFLSPKAIEVDSSQLFEACEVRIAPMIHSNFVSIHESNCDSSANVQLSFFNEELLRWFMGNRRSLDIENNFGKIDNQKLVFIKGNLFTVLDRYKNQKVRHAYQTPNQLKNRATNVYFTFPKRGNKVKINHYYGNIETLKFNKLGIRKPLKIFSNGK